jgi:hypothetical protein
LSLKVSERKKRSLGTELIAATEVPQKQSLMRRILPYQPQAIICRKRK